MEEHHHIKPNCKLCFAMWKNGKDEGITNVLEIIDDFEKRGLSKREADIIKKELRFMKDSSPGEKE